MCCTPAGIAPYVIAGLIGIHLVCSRHNQSSSFELLIFRCFVGDVHGTS
jgi:hypothetical protein